MQAEVGEIVDSWMDQDRRDLEKILNLNSKHEGKYWIILFQQTTPHKKLHFHGAKPIGRCLKAYAIKPPPLVGCMIGEVDNRTGELTWEIYPKDIPFTWSKLSDMAKPEIYKCKIPQAYIYNKVEA